MGLFLTSVIAFSYIQTLSSFLKNSSMRHSNDVDSFLHAFSRKQMFLRPRSHHASLRVSWLHVNLHAGRDVLQQFPGTPAVLYTSLSITSTKRFRRRFTTRRSASASSYPRQPEDPSALPIIVILLDFTLWRFGD